MLDGDIDRFLAELVARPAWMADALCREHPEAVFFPTRGQTITDETRALCRRWVCRPPPH